MKHLALADVSRTGRQKIYKISPSCTEGRWWYKLARTVQFARADGITSLSVVSMVTDHKTCENGDEEGGGITQSLS